MMDLGRAFDDKKLAVQVKSVEDIEELQSLVHEYLFEDTSIVVSKLYHGVYAEFFKKGYGLAIGLTGGQVEVLLIDWFMAHDYTIVGKHEFINNKKEW